MPRPMGKFCSTSYKQKRVGWRGVSWYVLEQSGAFTCRSGCSKGKLDYVCMSCPRSARAIYVLCTYDMEILETATSRSPRERPSLCPWPITDRPGNLLNHMTVVRNPPTPSASDTSVTIRTRTIRLVSRASRVIAKTMTRRVGC